MKQQSFRVTYPEIKAGEIYEAPDLIKGTSIPISVYYVDHVLDLPGSVIVTRYADGKKDKPKPLQLRGFQSAIKNGALIKKSFQLQLELINK